MKRPLIALLLAEIFVIPFGLQAARPDSVSTELKLITIIVKQERQLHENLVIKTIFTNVSGKILCFPEPAVTEEVPAEGYLVTRD